MPHEPPGSDLVYVRVRLGDVGRQQCCYANAGRPAISLTNDSGHGLIFVALNSCSTRSNPSLSNIFESLSMFLRFLIAACKTGLGLTIPMLLLILARPYMY